MTTLQVFHCCFDILITFVLFGLAWETTDNWSFLGTPQQRWAAYRRVAYAMMGVGFFARAMMLADQRMDIQVTDLLSGICISLPVVFFLVVRALGLVSQDNWVGADGYRRHRQRGRIFHWPG